MSTWRKLKRWEANLEKGPKTKLIRTLLICFAVSMLAGLTLSKGIYIFQVSATDKMLHEIKESEKLRMNQKIQELRMSLYERNVQK